MPPESESPPARDWRSLNASFGFGIPDEEIDRIAVVLDGLLASCERATRSDLSLVEPIGTFDPTDE